MLSFERLRILHAVATYGSVNARASALHVTNSAQQIAKLESELGQPLLERNGRGVRLTDAAAVLASNAQQMLALMDRAEVEFDEHREIISGHRSALTTSHRYQRHHEPSYLAVYKSGSVSFY
jgi:DNA-binding transcriptional LysR family regulator